MDEDMFQINNLPKFIQLIVDLAWSLNSIFLINNSEPNSMLDFEKKKKFFLRNVAEMYLFLSIPILPTLITSYELSHLFLAILLARSLLPLTHPAPSKLLLSAMFIVDPHSLVNGTAGFLRSSQGLLLQSPLCSYCSPPWTFCPRRVILTQTSSNAANS